MQHKRDCNLQCCVVCYSGFADDIVTYGCVELTKLLATRYDVCQDAFQKEAFYKTSKGYFGEMAENLDLTMLNKIIPVPKPNFEFLAQLICIKKMAKVSLLGTVLEKTVIQNSKVVEASVQNLAHEFGTPQETRSTVKGQMWWSPCVPELT